MSIAAGRLRHRVHITEPLQTLNDAGALTTSWADYGRYWAEVAPVSGRDYIAAQAAQSKVTVRITMRYFPAIKAGMRVEHRDKFYHIEAILPDADSGMGYQTLLCSEGVKEAR